MWSDPILERPENSMTGVTFTRAVTTTSGARPRRERAATPCTDRSTGCSPAPGLEYGDVLGAASTIVGYECDGCDFTYRDGRPARPEPTAPRSGFEILATAPAARSTAAPRYGPCPTTCRPSWSTWPPACSEAAIRGVRPTGLRPRVLGTYTGEAPS